LVLRARLEGARPRRGGSVVVLFGIFFKISLDFVQKVPQNNEWSKGKNREACADFIMKNELQNQVQSFASPKIKKRSDYNFW